MLCCAALRWCMWLTVPRAPHRSMWRISHTKSLLHTTTASVSSRTISAVPTTQWSHALTMCLRRSSQASGRKGFGMCVRKTEEEEISSLPALYLALPSALCSLLSALFYLALCSLLSALHYLRDYTQHTPLHDTARVTNLLYLPTVPISQSINHDHQLSRSCLLACLHVNVALCAGYVDGNVNRQWRSNLRWLK